MKHTDPCNGKMTFLQGCCEKPMRGAFSVLLREARYHRASGSRWCCCNPRLRKGAQSWPAVGPRRCRSSPECFQTMLSLLMHFEGLVDSPGRSMGQQEGAGTRQGAVGASCHAGQGIGAPPVGGGKCKRACRGKPRRSLAAWLSVSLKSSREARGESMGGSE